MPPTIIAVVGGINMDLVIETERIPDSGESMDGTSLAKYPGGKGANTAIATYRASHVKPKKNFVINGSHEDDGIRVCMNGAVGKDEFGTQLLAKLAQSGIDVSGVHTIENEESGVCVVIVEADSGESRNLAYQGANLKWKPSNPRSVESLAGGVKPELVIAHLGIPREAVEQVLATAHREGVDTLLNPSPAVYLVSEVYKTLTHLTMNETEAAMLYGYSIEEFNNPDAWQEAADEFLKLGVRNVVITLGAKGAYYATEKGDKGIVEAEKDVIVVDTTGAGDTFVGTYAVEYVEQKRRGEWDIRRAILRACKASARTIERLGAQEAIPWADEVDAQPKIDQEQLKRDADQGILDESPSVIDNIGPQNKICPAKISGFADLAIHQEAES